MQPKPGETELPSGYGRDRVRALPVDPLRLYVYWEVTKEGVERARRALAGGTNASLTLRVYDTTGRLFGGTNAHSFFDRSIEGESRARFLRIEKPGSEAFVEIGMKSEEGRFRRIVRSGRVAFPPSAPAPPREPRWLTGGASLPESSPLQGISSLRLRLERLLSGASEGRLGGGSSRARR